MTGARRLTRPLRPTPRLVARVVVKMAGRCSEPDCTVRPGAAGCAPNREESMTVYMEKTEFQKSRAFSPAVITQGGRTVWLAGQTATRDAEGRDISGNFDAQVNTIFALLDATLRK